MTALDQQSVPQATLDEWYWHTGRTLRSIAAEVGLSAHEVTKAVTPLPAGASCWWCREPVVFRTRAERNNALRRYSYLRCQCGAWQPRIPDDPSLVPSLATILIPMRDGSHNHGASSALDAGIDALAGCGLRWTGQYRSIDVTGGPDDVIRAIADLPERVVVVPALRQLATNDGDALGLFIRLVTDGWRVITSANPNVGRMHGHAAWYEDSLLGNEWDG